MLLLAVGLGGDRGDILEIELPAGHGGRPLDRVVPPLAGEGDAPIVAQDLPHRAGGARQAQPRGGEVGIAPKIIEDGFGAWGALQVVGRLVPDLEDAVNDARVEWWGGCLRARE